MMHQEKIKNTKSFDIIEKLNSAIKEKNLKLIEDILINIKENNISEPLVYNTPLIFPERHPDVNFEMNKTELFLKYGQDINIISSNNQSNNILYETYNMELLKFYIDKGADIHFVCKRDKRNLLFNGLNPIEKIKFLIESGVNIKQKNNLDENFLFGLLTEPDILKEVIPLIDFDIFKNNVAQGGSLLTECRNLESLQILIDNGCDVNINLYDGEPTMMSTALTEATFNSDRDSVKLDKVKLLLKNGANPNLVRGNGEKFEFIGSEEMDIISGCSLEILEELIKYGLDIKSDSFYEKIYLKGNPYNHPKIDKIVELYNVIIAKEEKEFINKSLEENIIRSENKKRL